MLKTKTGRNSFFSLQDSGLPVTFDLRVVQAGSDSVDEGLVMVVWQIW